MKKTARPVACLLLLLLATLHASAALAVVIYREDSVIALGNNDISGVAIVAKGEGSEKYQYTIRSVTEYLPLQMGTGEYSVTLFQYVEEGKFKKAHAETFIVKEEPRSTFLHSANPVYWDDDMEAIKVAKTITKDAVSDEEKVLAVHDHIAETISYDWAFLENIPYMYVPNIEETFSSRKGVCYHYSALFAGMMRSLGIPTKLIKGFVEDGAYHAWNEVLVNGEWRVLDLTHSAAYVQAGRKVEVYRDPGLYIKVGEY